MRVGVPKEVKVLENRVGLTPASVHELVAHGHDVVVESNAGQGIGLDDDAYLRVGATIAASADEVFAAADMIVKVKEPQAQERRRLRPGQILFTYLHLAPDPEQTRDLVASGAVCIAYETIRDARGTLPLLTPMSEVAGRMSISGRRQVKKTLLMAGASCWEAFPACGERRHPRRRHRRCQRRQGRGGPRRRTSRSSTASPDAMRRTVAAISVASLQDRLLRPVDRGRPSTSPGRTSWWAAS